MSLENLPENLFLQYGGVYDFQQQKIPALEKAMYRDVLRYNQDQIQFVLKDFIATTKIVVMFNASTKLGACIEKRSNVYYIGINIGTVKILMFIFHWLLSSDKVFSSVGHIDPREKKSVEDPHLIELNRLYDVIRENPSLHIFTADDERLVLAAKLGMNAINFLVLHELGHILCGHIDYMNNQKLHVDGNLEINNLYLEEQKGLVSQALEIDADDFASNYALKILREFYNTYHPQKLEEDFLALFRASLFAILIPYRLTGLMPYNEKKLSHLMHPPMGFRVIHIVTTLDRMVKKRFKLSTDINEIIGFVMMEIESGLADIGLDRSVVGAGTKSYKFASENTEHLPILGRTREKLDGILTGFANKFKKEKNT